MGTLEHTPTPLWKAILRGDLGQIYRACQDPAVTSGRIYRIAQFTGKQHGKEYKSRVVNCPPPRLFGIMRQRADTPSQFIHRAYCRALWRERRFGGRAKLLAILLLWPLIFAATSVWATALNGRAVARQSGKPVPRQIWEQLIAAWRFGCLPPWYYIFELFDGQHFARGGEYLHRFETKGGIFRLMRTAQKKKTLPPLRNKSRFAEKCRANGLPIAEELFIHKPGESIAGLKLPPRDLFIKPINSNGGSGAQAWTHVGDGRYLSLLDGESLDERGLLERIRGSKERLIVQGRLVNHDDIRDLSNGALATVRMMTLLNETGDGEVTHACLRMAIGANRLVDNFHAGGIIAAIDMKTGEVGPASDIGLRPDIGWCSHHPDTGAAIAGRILPLWRETVELARHAHAVFAPHAVIGWDIAITNHGPVIIEGNLAPDVDLVQRAHRGPIGNTRFGELLCHHLRSNAGTMALVGNGSENDFSEAVP